MKKPFKIKNTTEQFIVHNLSLVSLEREDFFPPNPEHQGNNFRYAQRIDWPVSFMAPDLVESVRFYEAFPIKGEPLRWHYCAFDPIGFSAHGDTPFPVGYCADKCPGHATAEEAREHFRRYIIDQCKFHTKQTEEPCRVCGIPSCGMAELAGFLGGMGHVTIPHHDQFIGLCQEHFNKDAVEKVFRLSDFQEFHWS